MCTCMRQTFLLSCTNPPPPLLKTHHKNKTVRLFQKTNKQTNHVLINLPPNQHPKTTGQGEEEEAQVLLPLPPEAEVSARAHAFWCRNIHACGSARGGSCIPCTIRIYRACVYIYLNYPHPPPIPKQQTHQQTGRPSSPRRRPRRWRSGSSKPFSPPCASSRPPRAPRGSPHGMCMYGVCMYIYCIESVCVYITKPPIPSDAPKKIQTKKSNSTTQKHPINPPIHQHESHSATPRGGSPYRRANAPWTFALIVASFFALKVSTICFESVYYGYGCVWNVIIIILAPPSESSASIQPPQNIHTHSTNNQPIPIK